MSNIANIENETFDIVKLMEKNPITRLSKDYQNKFLTKIKETFTETQQQLFVSSFYCFLNYHSKNEFVIDLDDVWKWIGFSRKDPAKRLLEKFFVENVDYTINKGPINVSGKGGGPNEIILLTVYAYKKFCLKSSTKKADEIHDYYIKLGELLQETMDEETNELRLQLEQKEKILEETKEESEKIKERLASIANRFKDKEKVGHLVYVGLNPVDETTFKVGITSNINERVSTLSTGSSKYFIMKERWYTRFNKEVEDSVKKKFIDFRPIKSKEFYQIDKYDEIVAFIEDLVEFYNKKDDQPQQLVENKNKRQIKNPTLDDKKACTKCNIVKQLGDFFQAKDHVDGHENRCRECVGLIQTAYIEQKRETDPVIPKEKQCSHCKEVKSLDEYYTDNNLVDRKGTKCKDCVRLVQTREKEKTDLTEYCCATCKTTKPIDEFHKLERSITGHKYSCKSCEIKKASERYNKHREQVLKGDLDDDEKEIQRVANRKKTVEESNNRRRSIIIICPCGVTTTDLGRDKHEKTAKHINTMKTINDFNDFNNDELKNIVL